LRTFFYEKSNGIARVIINRPKGCSMR